MKSLVKTSVIALEWQAGYQRGKDWVHRVAKRRLGQLICYLVAVYERL